MRTVRALVERGLTAGAVALACTATARAEEPAGIGSAQDGAGAEQPSRPPRPPLPPAPRPAPLPWARHIEIGGDVALVSRPVSTETGGEPTRVRYEPAIGLGLHARWEIVKHLRFSAFFLHATHDLALMPGALGLPGTITGAPRKNEAPTMRTITLGARLAPTLELSPRARSWLSVGIGYDRFDVSRMYVHEPGREPFIVRERGTSFLEVPLGLGVSFDLIRNWLTIELESSGAFLLGKGGDATRMGQAVDSQGHRRAVGALPRPQASFVHTLGLSLVL